ncbi:MAG: hypothetical protein WCY02_00565 [Parvibaculum sp.]
MQPVFTIFTLILVMGLFHAPRAAAADPLPVTTFRLSCLPGGSVTLAAEREAMLSLLDFARENDGAPVYLDAAIAADAGAGFCSRDLATPLHERREGEEGPDAITFNGCKVDPEARCSAPDMVQIDADGPPLAYRHSIFLPTESALPRNLPYRLGRYGDWLNYQGPFIARYFEGTGYAYATFHVPDPALGFVWERAAETPRPSAEDE